LINEKGWLALKTAPIYQHFWSISVQCWSWGYSHIL